MANQDTPGVDFEEVDESFFIRGAATGIGSMVGGTQMGPMSTPTLVSSWKGYTRVFGVEIAGTLLPYVAHRALDQGAQFYVVREDHKVAGVHQSQTAWVSLLTIGGSPAPAQVVGNKGATFAMNVGDQFGVKVDGGAAVNSAAIAAGAASMQTNVGPYALQDGDQITWRVGAASEPTFTSTFHAAQFSNIAAATEQEVLDALASQLIGVDLSTSSGHLVIATNQQGTGARLEIVSTNRPGCLTALGLSVGVQVGSGNVADLRHITVAEIVNKFSSPTGFTIADDGSGHVAVTGTAAGAGHSIQIVDTVAGTAAELGLSTAVANSSASGQVPTLKVSALTPGAWATNNLQVTPAAAHLDPANKFRWDVSYLGTVVESVEEASMDPTSDRYIVKLTANSSWLTVQDLLCGVAAPNNRPAFAAAAMANGADAITTMVDADVIGDSAARTGFYAMDRIRDAFTLCAPGWTSQTVFNAGVAYCDNRKDMLYVASVPNGLTPAQAADYRNATGAYSSGVKPDSSFGSLYFDWLNIDDVLTGLTIDLPPDGEVLAAMSRCDFAWQAPAGGTRGKVPAINNLVYDCSDDELGQMYRIGINPLYTDPDFGPVIWGQKTLQVTPSATDRVNVRLLYIYLRKSIGPAVKKITFEANDDVTWRQLKRLVNPFMRDIKKNRGVYDFSFKLDSDSTTATDIDNNTMISLLYVKPTKTAEFIKFQLISTPTGTSFKELGA